MREPVSSLRRADVVILTRADLVDEASRTAIWQIVKANNRAAARVELSFMPAGLVDKAGKQHADEKANVLAFCGIGNPDGFRKTLAAAEIPIQDLIAFPDHHHYDQDDIQKLVATAEKLEAKVLITTLKDLVKIEPAWAGSAEVVALNIEAQVTSGKELLAEAISKATPRPNR